MSAANGTCLSNSPAWSRRFPSALLAACIGTVVLAVAVSAAETPVPRTTLRSHVANLNPPTVAELVARFDPVPEIEELLASTLADSDTQEARMLGPRDLDRARHMTNQIEMLQKADRFDEAYDEAMLLMKLRTRVQGAQHWETVNARQLAEDIKINASLSPADRLALAEAGAYDYELHDLYRAGLYAKALQNQDPHWRVRQRLLPDDHSDRARCLVTAGICLTELGEFDEAEKAYRAAAEGLLRSDGAGHPNTLAALNNLAELLRRRGRYADAALLYPHILYRLRAIHGERHANYLTVLNNVGLLFNDQGDYKRGEKVFRRVLEARREILGPDHPDVGVTISNLALSIGGQGRESEAVSLYREALEILRKQLGEEHVLVALTMDNLAVALRDLGEFAEAEPLQRRALAMRRKLLGDAHPFVAESLRHLALLRLRMGMTDEAEQLWREALAVARRALSDTNPNLAVYINGLALCLNEQGKLDQAETLYRQALDLYRRTLGADHPRVTGALGNLGELLRNKGDLAAAEDASREVLRIRRVTYGNTHPDVALALNNLAFVLQDRGDLSGALRCAREALAIWRETYGDEHPRVALGTSNVAEMLRTTGQPDEAALMFAQSLDMRRKLLGDTHPDLAVDLNNLALARLDQGKNDAADALLNRAADLLRDAYGESHPDLATCLANLADIAASRDDYREAERLLRESLAISERQRARVVGDERTRARYAGALNLEHRATELARVLVRLNRTEEALAIAERGRGRALLDLLERSRSDLLADAAGDNQQLAERLKRLQLAEQAARQKLASAEAALATRHRKPSPDVTNRRPSFEAEIAEISAARRELHAATVALQAQLADVWPDARPMQATEIRAALAPEELLLCYLWTDNHVAVLAVPAEKHGDIRAFTIADDTAEVAELAALAKGLRDKLSRRGRPNDLATLSAAREFTERVVPADLRALTQGVERLVVLPAGPLNDIPFAAFRASGEGADQDYWLTQAPPVAYAESATVYLNRRNAADQPKAGAVRTAALLGNPTFRAGKNRGVTEPSLAVTTRGLDTAAAQTSAIDKIRLFGGTLSPLPGTAREVHGIATTLARANKGAHADAIVPLLARNATVEKLEAAVAGKRYVHIATHGLTGSRERPYDAALAMTQPAEVTPADTGFLTLDYLIRNWRGRLTDCELVVLSACDTQRGVKAGDSVMALPWGFFYAGADTVVASLWKVDDIAATLLMGRFYQNLTSDSNDAGSLSKLEALTEAQHWLRTLTTDDARVALGVTSDKQWEKLWQQRGLTEVEAAPATPDRDVRPFDHPYYWAAFVLIGDPG